MKWILIIPKKINKNNEEKKLNIFSYFNVFFYYFYLKK